MVAALVIHPDGEIVTVNLNPHTHHLALMREHLDCRHIDVVALTDKLDMWIDDESLYNHPVNPGGHRSGSALRAHLAGTSTFNGKTYTEPERGRIAPGQSRLGHPSPISPDQPS